MSTSPTLVDTTRAEFLKFRTVRATFIGLITLIVLTIGLAVLITLVIKANWSQRSPVERLAFDPVATSLVGVFFAQFAVGVLGARNITSEYASGAIRTTLAAVPRRVRLVVSKVIVLLVTFFVVGQVVVFCAFEIGQMIYRSGHLPSGTLSNSTDLRAVIMAGIYLTLLTLVGFGLGLILRTTSVTISIYVTLLLIIPIIVNFLPSSWQDHISKYLPSNLGQSMTSPSAISSHSFSWGTATIVLVIYTIVIVGIGTLLLTRRDA
ncbi:MAG: ABC transporter permease subunit [Actinomycetota bacterium]|nr:ABC transporter permease subunit [Actinomycetota bacterium]